MPDEINTNPVSAESEEAQEDINALRQIRLDKLNELCAAGEDPFKITTADQSAHAQEIVDNFEAMEGKEVSICGRMMSRRDMGKANFIDIRDRSGRIQVYVRINDVGEDTFAKFRSGISAISLKCAARCSRPAGARYPSTQPRFAC